MLQEHFHFLHRLTVADVVPAVVIVAAAVIVAGGVVDSYCRFLLLLRLAAAVVGGVPAVAGAEAVVVADLPVAPAVQVQFPVATTPPVFVTDHLVDLAESVPKALHYYLCLMQPVRLVPYLSKPSLKLDFTNQSQ